MKRGIKRLWHKLKLSKPDIFAFLIDKAFDISNFDNFISQNSSFKISSGNNI